MKEELAYLYPGSDMIDLRMNPPARQETAVALFAFHSHSINIGRCADLYRPASQCSESFGCESSHGRHVANALRSLHISGIHGIDNDVVGMNVVGQLPKEQVHQSLRRIVPCRFIKLLLIIERLQNGLLRLLWIEWKLSGQRKARVDDRKFTWLAARCSLRAKRSEQEDCQQNSRKIILKMISMDLSTCVS